MIYISYISYIDCSSQEYRKIARDTQQFAIKLMERCVDTSEANSDITIR